MVKRKVSLSNDAPARTSDAGVRAPSEEVLELFFDTGVVFHEVEAPPLPDIVSGFKVMRDPTTGAASVRRAEPGEEPDVEVSAVDHLPELSHRWLPVPYQLSCPFAVQVYLAPTGDDPRAVRVLLAVDTLEQSASQGRHLDAALDAGRPFRPLDRTETAAFLDHPETRELCRRMEKAGVDKAPFKVAALLDALGPVLPRLRFSKVEEHTPIPVSLVLDLGNSRSTAVLVERRDQGLFAVPLEVRSASDPFAVSDETFDSRVTFLPSAFDRSVAAVAVGECFARPSIVKMGREALDRALETPARYLCTLSGPKRYLWDDRPSAERWHYATAIDPSGAGQGEHKPIFGRILKYLVEEKGGLQLRGDGPATPADPRYAPRAMMLFALVEILSQAIAQVNSVAYRAFQGKEQVPRVLRHVALTFPSAMRKEERDVYEALAQNAAALVCHVLGLPPERRPNFDAASGAWEPFLFVDEALAAQMVYVYQEVAHEFSGSFEELAGVYGKNGKTLRVASIDIGGGTSDVMIADYADKQPGVATSLTIKKLFQDGVSVAGDEVCRAVLEDVVFSQVLAQLPNVSARTKLVNLFGEGDGGHGEAWRSLRAKLVPYFWLPLARCFWALAEGREPEGHAADKLYGISDVFRAFDTPFSPYVVEEVDRFLGAVVPKFPGLLNVVLKLDRAGVEASVLSVLREPLRKYADIVAQFDADLLVLAGRTSALRCVRDLFESEMPLPPPRIKSMASYGVSEWYPSRWQEGGRIKDPKSTVTAGAAVLHLASKNRLPGFMLDEIVPAEMHPIYGVYQDKEPHVARDTELFRKERTSAPMLYTAGMMLGFRNVDSEEMDGSPLFEVRPANADVEQALLEDRVNLRFALDESGRIAVADVSSQRDVYSFGKDDFVLALKTITTDRYWLDSGVFRNLGRYV